MTDLFKYKTSRISLFLLVASKSILDWYIIFILLIFSYFCFMHNNGKKRFFYPSLICDNVQSKFYFDLTKTALFYKWHKKSIWRRLIAFEVITILFLEVRICLRQRTILTFSSAAKLRIFWCYLNHGSIFNIYNLCIIYETGTQRTTIYI